jgi:hypothetical protein
MIRLRGIAAAIGVVAALAAPAPAAASGPWNENSHCVDTTFPATAVPPPPSEAFQIFRTAGVTDALANGIQSQLVSHSVSATLNAGLGSNPRGHPNRIPIYLTPSSFDPAKDLGVTNPTCQNSAADGIVVRTNFGGTAKIAATTAHELFHAYSSGLAFFPGDPWFEEAAATWSEARMGFGEQTRYDGDLQFPNKPLDEPPGTFAYAMSRFLLFMEDKNLVTSGGAWPLVQEVIKGYTTPGATPALSAALGARGVELGLVASEFWADRLKLNPAHGPRLVPKDNNSNTIEIEPGGTEVPVPAKRLHTKLLQMKISDEVQRVEFEFEAPANGYFWGLVKPNQVRRFQDGDSVSFCLGGSDQDDESWPGKFPVTFTNGNLAEGQITGTIRIFAQRSVNQCKGPTFNEACQVLTAAGAQGFFGAGSFFFFSGEPGPDFDAYSCFYGTNEGEHGAFLRLVRHKKKTAREVRKGVKRAIESGTFEKADIGDIGGVRTETDDAGTQTIMMFAVGRSVAFMQVDGGRARGLRFGRKVARAM